MAIDKAEENAEQTEEEQEEKTVDSTVDADKAAEKSKAKVDPLVELQKFVEGEKSKVQSAFEKKASTSQRAAEEALQKMADAEERTRKTEERLRNLEQQRNKVEEERLSQLEGGDVLIQLRRELLERERLLSDRETEASKKYAAGEFGLKVFHAQKFAKEYELGDDYEKLLEAKTPEDMEKLALKLQLDKLKKDLDTAKAGQKKEPDKKDEDELNPDSGAHTAKAPTKYTDDQIITLFNEGKLTGSKWQKKVKDILDKLQGG
jgi:hypothetical protein